MSNLKSKIRKKRKEIVFGFHPLSSLIENHEWFTNWQAKAIGITSSDNAKKKLLNLYNQQWKKRYIFIIAVISMLLPSISLFTFDDAVCVLRQPANLVFFIFGESIKHNNNTWIILFCFGCKHAIVCETTVEFFLYFFGCCVKKSSYQPYLHPTSLSKIFSRWKIFLFFFFSLTDSLHHHHHHHHQCEKQVKIKKYYLFIYLSIHPFVCYKKKL